MSSDSTARPKLNILVVVELFPRFTQTFILSHITNLIDRGHNVYIFANKKGNTSDSRDIVSKYNLIERTHYQQIPDLNRFDIILCQFGNLGLQFAKLKLKQNFKAKIVTCFRGYDLSGEIKKNPHIYDSLFEIGDLFLPVCSYFKDRLVALGCPSEKVIVHYSDIDCSKFYFRSRSLGTFDKIRIITIARLVNQKGLEYAIRTVAKIYKQYSNITYRIVGDGRLKEQLKTLIRTLKAERYIKLLGSLDHNQIIEILNKAHLFILPSVTSTSGCQEGMPVALQEAMAMGLPVIGTYHSGISELIADGKNGFLVKERDVNGLTEKIKYLIRHPEIWNKIGKAGRKEIEDKYETKKLNNKLVEIFYHLLK